MNYFEEQKLQFDYLDKINFKPYIRKYEDLDDLWHAVESDYDDTPLSNNNFLHGCIFNYIDRYELSCYLLTRYGINYREEETIAYKRDYKIGEF